MSVLNDALYPSQHFFSHVGLFSWVKPVLIMKIKCLAQGLYTVPIVGFKLDWLQSLKQFFINVSYHILVASLTLMALFQIYIKPPK